MDTPWERCPGPGPPQDWGSYDGHAPSEAALRDSANVPFFKHQASYQSPLGLSKRKRPLYVLSPHADAPRAVEAGCTAVLPSRCLLAAAREMMGKVRDGIKDSVHRPKEQRNDWESRKQQKGRGWTSDATSLMHLHLPRATGKIFGFFLSQVAPPRNSQPHPPLLPEA